MTMATIQPWQLVNLDKRETLECWGNIANFREISSEHFFPLYIVRLLAIPVVSSKILMMHYNPKAIADTEAHHAILGTFRKLPVELLHAIFSFVDDLQDAICFCLTNTTLLLVGISHVNILLAAMAARWAGDRVICLTENTRNEDLPSNLLTEAEKQELSEVHWSYPSDLFGLVCDRFQKPTRYSGAAFDVFTAQLGRLESQRFDMLSIPDYPNDPPWVLCNLSKGEYFRAEAIRDLTGHAFIGPFKRNRTGVGLGEILLFRICLSPASMYKGNIRPGVWAGDRFAITTVRGMERLRGTAAWKDISEEITTELLAIVEETYGDQWIEYV